MDQVLKAHYDSFRESKKLPPELEGKLEGILLPDQKLVDQWRNWRQGLRYVDQQLNASLFGALDDCLLINENYVPIDIKTRGDSPKEGFSEQYYQTQLDCYSFLLKKNGYKTDSSAYLVYYYPKSVSNSLMVQFETKVVKITTNDERIYKLFKDAIDCLNGPLPERDDECDYCSWFAALMAFK